MSNPFQEHFKGDPSAQERLRTFQEQLAKKQQMEMYVEKRQSEIQRYNAMVVEVLEELRDAAYPDMIVESVSLGRDEMSNTMYWQLGYWKTSSRINIHGAGGHIDDKFFVPKIKVGLILNDQGEALNFIGVYCGNGGGTQQRIAPLVRDELVQLLVDLHQPNRYAEIAKRMCPVVDRTLKEVMYLPIVQKSRRWFELHTPVEFGNDFDPRIDPTSISDSGERIIGPWEITWDAGDGDYSKIVTILEFSIVFDTSGNPSHYRCEIPGLPEPAIFPLDETALFTQIERAFFSLHADKVKASQPSIQQPQKKKKWWQ